MKNVLRSSLFSQFLPRYDYSDLLFTLEQSGKNIKNLPSLYTGFFDLFLYPLRSNHLGKLRKLIPFHRKLSPLKPHEKPSSFYNTSLYFSPIFNLRAYSLFLIPSPHLKQTSPIHTHDNERYHFSRETKSSSLLGSFPVLEFINEYNLIDYSPFISQVPESFRPGLLQIEDLISLLQQNDLENLSSLSFASQTCQRDGSLFILITNIEVDPRYQRNHIASSMLSSFEKVFVRSLLVKSAYRMLIEQHLARKAKLPFSHFFKKKLKEKSDCRSLYINTCTLFSLVLKYDESARNFWNYIAQTQGWEKCICKKANLFLFYKSVKC